jgi:superfamily II DNA or RNA helicase
VNRPFINEESLGSISWQAFERVVGRLLLLDGYDGVRMVGQTSDHGADVIAHKHGKRWLFQIKRWKNKIGVSVLDETMESVRVYRAAIPAVVALNGFDDLAREHQRTLLSRGVPMQLWDRSDLLRRVGRLEDVHPFRPPPRDYQEEAIKAVLQAWQENLTRKAMIVMATGLGKTYTAAEAVRRISMVRPQRILVLAHTNEIVYQLERAFWPFLKPSQETIVWNGYEQPSMDDLQRSPLVFACLNSVAAHLESGGALPDFDLLVIDECHHVGGEMYKRIIADTRAGSSSGPFLLGLTATPWRPDETNLSEYFGEPLFTMDMVTGLRLGFLANVDYRMYTDNIDWKALPLLHGARLTPKQINRTLFISEWDNAVVRELQRAWVETRKPRAIVFCGTIDHAITMRDQINALGFCNAAAIYSQTQGGQNLQAWERNRMLCDFHDGTVNVICAVDVFNEGVDVPDVNLIVFQRVTHSRRIFIQQLGRGLRLAEDKQKVIVLDFVSDIRRFAAGINLKNNLEDDYGPAPGRPVRIRLQHTVSFRRAGLDDPESETFLRQWIEDVATVENAGEDASVLKFPPSLNGGKL